MKLTKTMTAGELIQLLQAYDLGEEIHLLKEAGNGWMISQIEGIDHIKDPDEKEWLVIHSEITTIVTN